MAENDELDPTDKGIAQHLRSLQTYEDIDPLFMPEELKKIRHFVIFVHERIE